MVDVARLSLEVSTTGVQRARQALQGLQDGSVRAQRATGQLSGALVRSSRSFKVNSQLINQAGFQVGDFATQVASGQNALVAFTQQFGQLAGFIGPAGPVLGAIVAIGGAIGIGLVNSMGDAVDATNEFQDYVDGLTDSFERLTAAQLKNAENLFYAENRQRQKQITDYREQIDGLIEQQNELNELINNPRQRALRGRATGISVSAEELRQRAQALNPEITALQSKIDSLTQAAEDDAETLDKMREGMNGVTDETSKAQERVDELNKSLQFQVETYGQSERAIALAKIAQLEKNGADAEAIRQARALTNRLFDKKDAQEAATEADKKAAIQARQTAKENAQFAKSWQALQDRLDPTGADLRELGNDIAVIQEAFSRGLITQEQADAAVNRLNQVGEATKQTGNGIQLFTETQASALSAFGQIFGNMAEIAEKGGKDQFDTWKAMASAQAAVNTALAISNALATPPAPVGIALAGTIGALGAVQIAQIQQTEYQGSFLGGGYTGTGSRTGGVDGRGGFPAILHPNETVIDHELAGSKTTNSSQVNQTVVMQISGDVTERTRTEIMKAMPMIREQAKAAVIQAAGRGGSMSKAVGRRR